MAGADSDLMPGSASAGPEIWVGTGWKMNKTIGEALAYAEALRADAPFPPQYQRSHPTLQGEPIPGNPPVPPPSE